MENDIVLRKTLDFSENEEYNSLHTHTFTHILILSISFSFHPLHLFPVLFKDNNM